MKTRQNPIRRKQFAALAKARDWARSNCEMMVRRSVLEAARYHPISELQWYNLQQVVGAEMVRDLKSMVGILDDSLL